MIATITLNKTSARDAHYMNNTNLEDSILASDLLCIKIGEFFSQQDRTYKSNGTVVIDTVSLHSNGPSIGLRFYWKTRDAKNKRGAFYAEFDLITEEVLEKIKSIGIEQFCDHIAGQAIKKFEKYS